ncbi:MAG: SDR family oxidoreductase [bacterium]
MNKTVLVTGSTGTIGTAVCKKFVSEKWRVLAHYHSSDEKARRLEKNKMTTTFQANFAKKDGPDKLASQILKTGLEVDAVINNCSIFKKTTLENISLEDWEKHLAINTRAPLFLIKHLAASLRKQQGVVINLTDCGLKFPYPGYLAYMASKGALETLTGCLARALGPEVRVNAIAPGPVTFPNNFTEKQKEKLINNTALKRAGKPEEIAELIFFTTTGATYSSGSTIHIDGGYHND